MVSDLAIYGAGGFGREVALMVHQINRNEKRWNLLGFFDDRAEKSNVIDGLPVLGGRDELNHWARELSVVVAIADPLLRMKVVSGIDNRRVDFPSIIHLHADTGSEKNKIGKGCIITKGCIFTTGITLGDFVIVNLATTIGHDVVIDDYAAIMPGCNISGRVSIGEGTLIGTGVQILQNISIGSYCKIGAGAVVTKHFSDRLTVVGVPAKQIKK